MSKLRSIHLITILVALLIVIVAFLLFPFFVFSATLPDDTKLMVRASKLQIPFVENNGQMKDKSVKFYASTFAGNVYVTEKGEIVYGFFKESLIGATLPNIKAEGKAATKVNYFVGAKDNWKAGIPTWDSVSLGEVYEGVELKLKAYGRNVEKLFIVNECGSVEDIKVTLEGADNLEVNSSGELEVETELGTVKFTKPFAYQEIDGKKIEVGCEFVITREQSDRSNLSSYGFQVASYNNNYPLVIDPLLASTFIGGNDIDYVYGIAIDTSGNVYITGSTYSYDFPTTPGAYDRAGSFFYEQDVFVSKLNNTLTSLLASTFIAGISDDVAENIAIDSSGNIYVVGYTESSNFPYTTGAYDTTINGYAAFISKLDNTLSSLLASTFIDYGQIQTITVSSSGNVFVTGKTNSPNFPTTADAYDTSFSGTSDSFISKLDNGLTSLLASTLIGGGYAEGISDLTIDSSGNIYITGGTGSIWYSSSYPTTPGAYDTTYGGWGDVFVSKLNNSLTTLLASTFLGGQAMDGASAIALDSSGNVYITGGTSTQGMIPPDFPTTVGAYVTSYDEQADIFISKFNNTLSSLIASTLGAGGSLIKIDSSGNIITSGWSVISKMNNTLSALLDSAPIESGYSDHVMVRDMDSSGNIFIAGYTSASDFQTTEGAYDRSYNGEYDVFVSKYRIGDDIPTAITLSSFAANQKGKKVSIKWETATEIDNIGFNILRSESESGPYEKINKKLINAKGTSTKGASYYLNDKNIESGKTYWYKLEDIDSNKGIMDHAPLAVKINYRKKK
ncbi:MAG: SBBP repeat-containing protein [Candidatus Schekmanbacteria bacterium]|nr:SBBP repeat-containing protein [Candidatus Schekmanbacteria bacterium]